MITAQQLRARRTASNKYWRRIRAERAALGLNSRGGVPQKKSYRLIGQGGHVLHGRARKNKYQQLMREQRYAAGLTATGKRPQRAHAKRGLILLTPLETDFRLFRSLIGSTPATNWEVIERV